MDVLHLERLPLAKPYPQQVDHIEALLLRDPLVLWKPRVLVDWAGVGRPVLDMFLERPVLRFTEGVVITAGRETTAIPAGWSALKVELVGKLQALLHSQQLKIPRAMPEAAVLSRELHDFRVRYTEAGHATFNARESAHDDLARALALAVFGLSRPEFAIAADLKVAREWR